MKYEMLISRKQKQHKVNIIHHQHNNLLRFTD